MRDQRFDNLPPLLVFSAVILVALGAFFSLYLAHVSSGKYGNGASLSTDFEPRYVYIGNETVRTLENHRLGFAIVPVARQRDASPKFLPADVFPKKEAGAIKDFLAEKCTGDVCSDGVFTTEIPNLFGVNTEAGDAHYFHFSSGVASYVGRGDLVKIGDMQSLSPVKLIESQSIQPIDAAPEKGVTGGAGNDKQIVKPEVAADMSEFTKEIEKTKAAQEKALNRPLTQKESVDAGVATLITTAFPDESTMTFKADDERAIVTAFVSPSCPYCIDMISKTKEINEAGITIRYLPMPGRPEDRERLDKISCAEDPKAAFIKVYSAQDVSSLDDCPQDYINTIITVAKAPGVDLNVFPLMFSSNGKRIEGWNMMGGAKELSETIGISKK